MLLAGCQKFPGTGKAIRFSAVTRSEAVGTKTAYSGVVDASGFERIDWVNGDKIQIKMTNTDETKDASYTVSGISASGRESSAKIQATDENNHLEWGTGDHSFWAAYPSSATFGSGTIAGAIASSQELSYKTTNNGVAMYDNDQTLYLFAGKKVPESAIGDPIELDFDPMMTTFDFEVGSNTKDDMVIRSFSMTTEYAEGEVADANLRALAGDFTATYDASMVRTLSTKAATDANRSITVNFAQQPAISQTKKVRFRVMALPQDIQGLTVVFNTTETSNAAAGTTVDKTHKLRLKKTSPTVEWITFTGCGKANITGLLIPGAEWKITFSGPRVQQWTVYDEVIIGVE